MSKWGVCVICSVTVASLLAGCYIGVEDKEEVLSVPPSLLTGKYVIFSLSLPELWVRHACSSATPPMPFLGSTSPQCEYLSLQSLFIHRRHWAYQGRCLPSICLHHSFLHKFACCSNCLMLLLVIMNSGWWLKPSAMCLANGIWAKFSSESTRIYTAIIKQLQ